jgi:uncharacterized protein (DUF433 family)
MTTSTPVDIGTLIYSDPNFRDGRACIAGTGMSVRSVARRYLGGMTAEEIADDIPDIPLSHFYAAITYYLANRERMDAEMAAEDEEAERLYQEWKRENPEPRRSMT